MTAPRAETQCNRACASEQTHEAETADGQRITSGRRKVPLLFKAGIVPAVSFGRKKVAQDKVWSGFPKRANFHLEHCGIGASSAMYVKPTCRSATRGPIRPNTYRPLQHTTKPAVDRYGRYVRLAEMKISSIGRTRSHFFRPSSTLRRFKLR